MTEVVDPSTAVVLGSRYRLGARLGAGGMAAVYRADDVLLDREVAVKIYRASATSQEEVDRQEAEIRTLASLSHHSLVTVLDAGVHVNEAGDPTIFLVMELLGGEDLYSRISRERLSSREIAYIGFDLAEGLEYLAHRGIVHRDIKPANILLVEYVANPTRLRAKLADFGIAKPVNGPDTDLAGTATGTAAYLSPEQAAGENVGSASDIYSLGLVLLECLTGERTFPGDPIPSAMARLSHDAEIPDSVSDVWKVLLAGMVARAPEDRPPLREVILSLRDIIISEIGRRRLTSTDLHFDEGARL